MRRLIRYAALVLALVLLGVGLYHGMSRDDVLPADYSSAALGLMLLEKPDGLYVLAVTQDSPADRSGVQPGDYLVASGDEMLSDLARLEALLHEGRETVPLTLRRDGQSVRIILPAR